MKKPKKVKVSAPPDRGLGNMDIFPNSLWMAPWFETRELDVNTPIFLPEWMNEASRKEILEQLPVDINKGAFWWAKLWQDAPIDAIKSPEFLMVATAMAATMGWPRVVENMLDLGAPLDPVPRPEDGWKWIGLDRNNKSTLRRSCVSVLDLCVWGMRGSSTVSPLHEGRSQAVDVLLARGADPQKINWNTAKEALSHGKMIEKLINAGLQATHVSGQQDRYPGVMLMDLLFSSDIDLANAARGRILDAFIKNGMPVHIAPDKPSLMEYMASSVAGLSQMEVALKHSDREQLMQDILANRASIEKKAQRMNEEKRDLFLERVVQAAIIDVSTPQVAPTRPRARI